MSTIAEDIYKRAIEEAIADFDFSIGDGSIKGDGDAENEAYALLEIIEKIEPWKLGGSTEKNKIIAQINELVRSINNIRFVFTDLDKMQDILKKGLWEAEHQQNILKREKAA